MPERLTVVGDALLDRDVEGRADRLAPDAPVPVLCEAVEHTRPGGAGLAALLAARDGLDVTLLTALGKDAAGRELRSLLEARGVSVVDLGRERTPEKVRYCAGDRSLLRVDHGDERDTVAAPDRAAAVLRRADAVLVADYGRGVASDPTVRAGIASVPERAPVVWDPHPRGLPPVADTTLVTPNRAEAAAHGLPTDSVATACTAAAELARRWHAAGVAITLGADGAVLGIPGRLPLVVPVDAPSASDPCGAGDRFAASIAASVARHELLGDAVAHAVRAASVFVGNGGVRCLRRDSAPPPVAGTRGKELARFVERTRAAGETVVATSGCFDLLHTGHLGMLEAARRLGDHLLVLLNSDASVRRLKGPGRPIVAEADRAALLRGLECVDAVHVFDEDTPERALDRYRPALFVKGDDYGASEIVERAVMRRWGGEVVVVPYRQGRSTSSLMEDVRRRV